MTNKHIELPALDTIVSNAMRSYLRKCSSGGMKQKTIDTVLASVDDAERLGYFELAIAQAILADRAAQQRVPAEQARVVGEPVAHVAGDDVKRYLQWANVAAFDFPVGTPVYAAPQEAQAGMVLVPLEFVQGFHTLAHNYSLQAIAPDYYHGVERDAFKDAYARCGSDLAKLRAIAMFAAPVAQPATEPPGLKNEASHHVDALFARTDVSLSQMATEQAEAPSDADPLTPEQEEWVMDLAEKHNLGRRVPQIGAMRGVAPDVFYTDASYRTHELFCFAAALLSTKELT